MAESGSASTPAHVATKTAQSHGKQLSTWYCVGRRVPFSTCTGVVCFRSMTSCISCRGGLLNRDLRKSLNSIAAKCLSFCKPRGRCTLRGDTSKTRTSKAYQPPHFHQPPPPYITFPGVVGRYGATGKSAQLPTHPPSSESRRRCGSSSKLFWLVKYVFARLFVHTLVILCLLRGTVAFVFGRRPRPFGSAGQTETKSHIPNC